MRRYTTSTRFNPRIVFIYMTVPSTMKIAPLHELDAHLLCQEAVFKVGAVGMLGENSTTCGPSSPRLDRLPRIFESSSG